VAVNPTEKLEKSLNVSHAARSLGPRLPPFLPLFPLFTYPKRREGNDAATVASVSLRICLHPCIHIHSHIHIPIRPGLMILLFIIFPSFFSPHIHVYVCMCVCVACALDSGVHLARTKSGLKCAREMLGGCHL